MSGSLSDLWERLQSLRGRERLDAELREEIETHIAMRRDELVASGLAPEEAERQARLRLGSASLAREDARAVWGFPALESIGQDLAYGARVLRRSPLFTVAAVLSLAVGIGASTAVFSLADALLLRKLPVRDPDALVALRWRSASVAPFGSLSGTGSRNAEGMASTSFSTPAFEAMRSAVAARADVFGFADLYRVGVGVDGVGAQVGGQVVSGNYFPALGLTPELGRLLSDADDRPDAPPVAMLSHAYWQERFGGAGDVVGRVIDVGGKPFTIVGVLPRGFHGTLQVGDDPDLTFPLARYGELSSDGDPADARFWFVLMMARLRPAHTAESLQPALDAVLAQTVLASKPGLAPKDLPHVELLPGSRGQLDIRERTAVPLALMAGVVGLLLLVACANVGSLQLARGEARAHEIATRVAIGASRARVVRQLLTEGLLLAALASGLGVLLARWSTSAMLPALGQGTTFELDLPLDARVLAFTLAVAGLCALAFGLVPALRTVHPQHGTRATRPRPLAGALVVAQVALTLVLVATAALLAGSARALQAVDPGFDPGRLLLVDVDPTASGTPPERLTGLYAKLVERLATLPGVEHATLSSYRLLSGSAAISTSVPTGAAVPAPGSPSAQAFFEAHETYVLAVDDAFFETYRLPLLRGRRFGHVDAAAAPPTAIVNRTLARRLFDTEDVVGRSFVDPETEAPPYTIVGVAGDAKYASLRHETPATMYVSARQQPPARATLGLKTAGDPAALASAVRAALQEVDPNLATAGVGTQAEQLRDSLRQERLFARLATLLGTATVLLSGIGLFALLGYSVARRTREIGVRMALGAERRRVALMVVAQSLRLVGLGLVLGIPASLAGTRLLESLLFGLTPDDPRVLGGAVLLMLALGVLAALLPARRAASVDPLLALRAE